MAFIFTLFCVLSIATITTQYKVLPDPGNDTDIFDLIKLLQDIADRASPSSDEPIDILNTFGIITDDDDNDDPKHDADDDNWEDEKDDYIQKPQLENILRWLPKRHRVKKQSKVEELEAQIAERNKQRARAQNAARAEYVVERMKTNYWTTLYLWGEVSRILRERQLLDDMREMIRVVEQEGNEHMKESVLQCYRKIKKSLVNVLWTDKKMNNLIIDHVKHPDHDGIIN